jgi:glycosyltransferase involved in cell wall biosynthesis
MKVTIAIPTYNTAKFLPLAVESVLAQTYRDFELIICDNASTDETPKLVQRWLSDERVRYVRFETLVNQGGNWNRCLDLARGDYVSLLHADDEYLPSFIADRVSQLDAHPSVGLAFGAVDIIDVQGNVTAVQSYRDDEVVLPPQVFMRDLLRGCLVSPVSPMVRRSCYDVVGRFNDDPQKLWGIDWGMWLRLAARWDVAYSPKRSARYRIHGNSGTSAGLLEAKNGLQDLEVLHETFQLIDSLPQLEPLKAFKAEALRSLGLRTLYAAAYNCDHDNIAGVRANLAALRSTSPELCWKPAALSLRLSCVFGPWVYRAFRRVRSIAPPRTVSSQT